MGWQGIPRPCHPVGCRDNWITEMKKMSAEVLKRYEETDRLVSVYKVGRQEWFNQILSTCPPEAIKVLRYVRQMPKQAEDDFLNRMQSLEWLMAGSADVKLMVLRVIEKRMESIAVLNDPLPPQTNMYFKARDILQVR